MRKALLKDKAARSKSKAESLRKARAMKQAIFAKKLKTLKVPAASKQSAALRAVAQAQGLKLPKTFSLAALLPIVLGLMAKYPDLFKGLPLTTILKLLPALLAIWQAASGGAAGKPGELPEPDETEDEDEKPPAKPPAEEKRVARTIVGLEGNYFNFQEGDPGKVKEVNDEQEKRHISGAEALNGDLKHKIIGNVTPQVQGASGPAVDLHKGEPENADVGPLEYAVIYDGKEYVEDAIQNCPIEVNNHEANLGMTPRLVFGPGIDGAHTVAFRVTRKLNRAHTVTFATMRIN